MTNNERFSAERTNTPRREMVMRYAQYLEKKYKYLCVVEGSSDRVYYSNIGLYDFETNHCAYFFHSKDDTKDKSLGKDAVIRTYRDIKADATLSKELYRTFFVVDRDYDYEQLSQHFRLNANERSHFSLTPYHSFECFFFTDLNLRELFAYLGIPMLLEKRFWEFLDMLRGEVADYFALVAASDACYKENWPHLNYKKEKDRKEIYTFNFSETGFSFNREWMNHEVKELTKAIAGHPLATRHYRRIKKAIQDKHLFIHGHTMESFLLAYLSQVCGVSMNPFRDEKFLHKMQIVMEFVFGDGTPFFSSASVEGCK